MELTSGNKRIVRLIGRDILGELDHHEAQELERWRQESEANERFYRRVTDGAYLKEKIDRRDGIDVAAHLRAFERSVGMRPRLDRKRIALYAAVAAVAVVLAVLSTDIWKSDKPTDMRMAEAIAPGTNKAILIVDDGRTFDLDESPKTIEIEQGSGISVVSDSSHISYRDVDSESMRGQMHRVVVPTGGEYGLELSDGTKVFLNAESEIEYPVRFAADRREVTLHGEAHFVVAASPDRPFIVKSGDVEVVVTGTEFNVKAYPDEDLVQTTLLRGRVSMLCGGSHAELAPSQQAEWSRRHGWVVVRDVDPEMFLAWRNGQFIFRQERLEDIMRALARWYDVEVVYLDESLKDMRFAGRLDRSQQITPILNIIRATDKITVDVEDRHITFGVKQNNHN